MSHADNSPPQKHSSIVTNSIIVAVLLLLFLAILIPNIMTSGIMGPSKRPQTVANMRAIGTALGAYHVDTGHYPILDAGTFKQIAYQSTLHQGMTTAYYDGTWKDNWGTALQYYSDGEGYTLKSYGSDRKPGGKREMNSDILYVNGEFVAPSIGIGR